MSVRYDVHGAVAVITLDNPPVNGLGLATRRAVSEGIDRAQDDPAVRAIVLAGAGKVFSGGADIKEFGTPLALTEPTLRSLIAQAENASKPVVAAIHGVCMGGGLELALGCHYRVCAPGADVALPEVKLGLLPGAGGTQRLPRALGVEAALNMIVGGEPAKSERLAALPGQRLFDHMIEGPLVEGAVAFAESIAGARPLPRVRDWPCAHPRGDAYFQFARNTVRAAAPHLPAPARCVDSVENATRRPFDEGLREERQAFAWLMTTPESRALRHAFFAPRAAARIAGVPESTPARPVSQVAIVGAGTMGSGIAATVLDAGLAVVLLESDRAALDRGMAAIRAIFETRVGKGRLSHAGADERLARLTPTLAFADAAGADLAIEAVFEDFDVKRGVLVQLDAALRPGAIIATNTSTLDVDRLAQCTARPADVVGLHFFSPAHVMKLLEVVRGARTTPDVLATAMQLGKRLRKTCVVAAVCDGFIGNRMIEQYFRQSGFLLEEGCSPAQVDRAMESFGFPMGPFRMADLAGNDVGWYIRKRRYVDKPNLRYSRTADRLCEMGRFGQKTAAGWYDYDGGRRAARPAPVVLDMIAAERAALGIEPRAIDDDEIVQRLVYALVNEGARLLEEGIAQRASDIDVVYMTGYGFPAWRGGPMCHADEVGVWNVLQAMKRFARNPHDDAAFWQPAPLLVRAAAEGRRLLDDTGARA